LKCTLSLATCTAILDASNVPQLFGAHAWPNGGISASCLEVSRDLLPLHRSLLPCWRVLALCGAHLSNAFRTFFSSVTILRDFLLQAAHYRFEASNQFKHASSTYETGNPHRSAWIYVFRHFTRADVADLWPYELANASFSSAFQKSEIGDTVNGYQNFLEGSVLSLIVLVFFVVGGRCCPIHLH
jgi:hypothetical protein